MPFQLTRWSVGRRTYGPLAIALVGMLWCQGALHAADEDPSPAMFSVHGFGTLGVVNSDARDADFVGTAFQPNGAGYSRAWAPGVDSKAGLQVGAQFTDRLSAIVQMVSQHIYDNTWRPQLEWANLLYQLTPDLAIRAGRSVAAPFMLSDTHLVGYTYPWIRPPPELYGELPVSNQDGVEVHYHLQKGPVRQSLSVSYGQTNLPVLDGGEVSARKFLLASDALELGALTVRIGYTSSRATTDIPTLDPLFAGLLQFGTVASGEGFASAGAQASALGNTYSLREAFPYAFSMATVGMSYDPGSWLLMSEAARTASDGLLAASTAWYFTGGYRFGKFTPFLTVAQVESGSYLPPGIATAGLPPLVAAAAANLNAALSGALGEFAPSQSSATAGLRWDAMKDIDFKLQFDRVRLDHNSSGRLGNLQPGFRAGPDVNAISIAMDFVF
jgi:hypothetical protein